MNINNSASPRFFVAFTNYRITQSTWQLVSALAPQMMRMKETGQIIQVKKYFLNSSTNFNWNCLSQKKRKCKIKRNQSTHTFLFSWAKCVPAKFVCAQLISYEGPFSWQEKHLWKVVIEKNGQFKNFKVEKFGGEKIFTPNSLVN